MYTLRFIKGMMLSNKSNPNEKSLSLTIKQEDPETDYIQCLDVTRLSSSEVSLNPGKESMFLYSNSVIFFNELDSNWYFVRCDKFRFIKNSSSDYVPLFFVNESVVNDIIMVFVSLYYNLGDSLFITTSRAGVIIKNKIDSNTDIFIDDKKNVVESSTVGYSNDLDSEFMDQVIFEEAVDSLEDYLSTFDNDLSNMTYEDAYNFSLVLNLQPDTQTRAELYKRLGISKTTSAKIKHHILKTFSDIEFIPRSPKRSVSECV